MCPHRNLLSILSNSALIVTSPLKDEHISRLMHVQHMLYRHDLTLRTRIQSCANNIQKKISYWLSPVVGLRRLSHGLFSLGRTGKTCLGDHRDLNQTDFHLHLCQFCTSSSQVAILAAWRRQSTLQKMKGKQLKLTHARAGHVYSSPDGLLRVWCFQLAAFF